MRRPPQSAVALITALAAASLAAAAPVASDLAPLSNSTIQLVKARLADSATDTWVGGTQMQALLEHDYPTLSVFSDASYPPTFENDPTEVISIVSSWASKRSSDAKQLAYVSGGAAADPAALGVGWLVAAAARGAAGDESTEEKWISQVKEEVEYIINDVPKTSDGAISHRPASEPAQLWADFMYMVPPVLAYYGVASNDASLIEEAYSQCALYRKYLKSSSGSWKHIVLGSGTDEGLWNTGNGWAAAGMARVLATIVNSDFASTYTSEALDLQDWINEILVAAFTHIKKDGLLPNYYDSASGSSFSDASGSALLAASAYRLATLNSTAVASSTLADAAIIRAAVNSKVDKSSGWVSPVVNPLSFKEQASESPEGEAFVLLLEAAWRDYALA
ncbi:hypothetical protein JCM11641_007423 [Rhodosporidiobolus odoratus]